MKKNLKKVVSAFLTVAMLFSLLSVSAFAAASSDANLIFDMDLSEASATNVVIKDSVANLTATAGGGVLPLFKEENGINFLQYRESLSDSTNNRVAVFENTAFARNEEMTFEFWIRPLAFVAGNDKGYRLFNLSISANGGDSNATADVFGYDSITWYRPYKNSGCVDYKYSDKNSFHSTNGKWSHYVYTRKWVPTESGSTTGTWEGDLYINGVKITRPSSSMTAEAFYNGFTDTQQDKFIAIGNKGQANAAFYGDIADVKVYNKVRTDSEILSTYNAEKSDYEIFEISSISSADNATIDTEPGAVKIKFSGEINIAALSGITFKKADGTDIKGAYSVTADGDTVTVEYGKLETGTSYKLYIPEIYKDGSTKHTSAKTYSYTAEKKYIVNEDFTGKTAVPDIDNIAYMSNSTANDKSAMSIKTTESGDYYLSVKPQSTDESGKNYKVTYNLPTPLDTTADADELHVVELKIASLLTLKSGKDTKANVARNFLDINGTATPKAGEISYDNILAYPYTDNGTKGSYINLAKDTDGFSNVRMAFGIHELADNSKLLGYEITDLNNSATVSFTPDASYAAGKGATDFPNKISSLLLSHIYTQSSDTCDAETRYSDIKIYSKKLTKVLKADKYSNATKSVTLRLNNDLPTGAIENIVVKSSDGTAVEPNLAYNEEDRSVTLTFASEIDGKYTVSLANVLDADGFKCSDKEFSFNAVGAPKANVVYKDGSDNPLTTVAGTQTIKATATLSNWEETVPVAFMAVYKGDKLESVVSATPSVSGTTVTYTAEITGLSGLLATDKVKFFIWKGLNTLTPAVAKDNFTGGSL